MKRHKFLPAIIMFILSLTLIGVGVYCSGVGTNNISVPIEVSGNGYNIGIDLYKNSIKNSNRITSVNTKQTQNLFTINNISFDVSEAENVLDVEEITYIFKIRNNSSENIGVYFWNNDGRTYSSQASITIEDELENSDILYGKHTMDAKDDQQTVYEDVVDVIYSMYHEIDGCKNSINNSGYPNEYTTMQYSYDYLKIVVRLNTLTAEDVSLNLSVYVNVEKYIATGEEEQITPNSGNDVITPNGAFSASTSGGFVKVPTTYTNCPNFNNNTNATHIVLPQSVTRINSSNIFAYCNNLKTVSMSNKLTNMNSYSFRYAYGLKFIEMPDSLTSLPSYAFQYCNNLEDVILSSNMSGINYYAFANCTSLKRITIPNSVTSLSEEAFYSCSNLQGIIIPDSVTSIGYTAFYNCTSLAYVKLGNNLSSINGSCFSGCTSLTSIVIPNSVTSINYSCFSGCTALESVTLSNRLTSLSSSLFSNCTSLTSINLPNSITSISDNCFYNCSSLESINIPNGVTTLSSSCFYNCSSLESINIPNSVTTIQSGCFYNCSSLESVNISNGVTIIYESAFNGCSSLEEVIIPNSVTTISEYCFQNCTSLESVTLSTNLTNIPNYCFNNCSSLASISFPAGITTIGNSAFYGCSSLQTLTIPASITTIRSDSFAYCYGLTSISVDPENTVYDSRNNCNAIIETQTNTMYFACVNTVIPNTVTSVYSYAYQGNPNITSIIFPSSVTNIYSDVFYNCTNLSYISIPAGSLSSYYTSLPSQTNKHWERTNQNYVYRTTEIVYYNSQGIYRLVNDIYSPDFSCSYNGSGNYSITNYNGDSAVIIVPNMYSNSLITGINNSIFQNNTTITSVTLPSSIYMLSTDLFNGCSNLETVIIQGPIATLPQNCFYNCTNLSSVTLSDAIITIDVSAFELCGSLEEVILSPTVTTIGNRAFYDCTSLESITIPSLVTTIGQDAFYNCSSLRTIVVESELLNATYPLPSIEGYYWTRTNNNVISIVTEIGSGANGIGTYRLVSVTTPSADTNGFIYTITDLTNKYASIASYTGSASVVAIPNTATINGEVFTITEVLEDAFDGNTSVTSLTIPSNIEIIDSGVLADIANLNTVIVNTTNLGLAYTLPTKTNYHWELINNGAISLVTSIAASNGAIGEYRLIANVTNASDYTYTLNTDHYIISAYTGNDTSVMVPNIYNGYLVKEIADNTFASNTTMTSVTIPASISSIGAGAFSGCSNLETVTINCLLLTSIGANAFNGCSNIEEFTVPATVTSIGAGAFAGCTSLDLIIVETSDLAAAYTLPTKTDFHWIKIVNQTDSITSTIPSGASGAGRYELVSNTVAKEDGFTYTMTDISNAYVRVDSYSGLTSELTIPTTVEISGTTFTITAINANAFINNTSLTSVTIPSNVTSIGNNAFYGCTGLEEITIPSNVTSIGNGVFEGCTGLETVTFSGTSLLTIGNGAFNGCTSFTEIKIPSSVTSIGSAVFAGCTNLETVTFNGTSLLTIGTGAFENCSSITEVTIPSSVTSIGAGAFAGCTNLETIEMNSASLAAAYTLPTKANYHWVKTYNLTESVVLTIATTTSGEGTYTLVSNTTANADADGYRYTITDIANGYARIISYTGEETALEIPDVTTINGTTFTITEIYNEVFKDNTNLTEVLIPDSITSIGADAFNGCTGLTEITIPQYVTTLGAGAFEGCSSVEFVIIDSTVLENIPDNCFKDCALLSDILIPDSITSFGNYAFAGCETLLSIYVPAGVESFGDYVFADCISLEEVQFNETELETMGDYAFSNCSALIEILIPETVESIGAGAFTNCTRLEEFTLPSSVTSVGVGALNGCNSITYIDIQTTSLVASFALPTKEEKHWVRTYNETPSVTTVVAASTSGQGIYTLSNNEYTSGGITYLITDLTNMYATFKAYTGSAVSYSIPSSVTIDGTAFAITTIYSTAFRSASTITTLTIPSSVTRIETNALARTRLANLTTIIVETSSLQAQYSLPTKSGHHWTKTVSGTTTTVTKIDGVGTYELVSN